MRKNYSKKVILALAVSGMATLMAGCGGAPAAPILPGVGNGIGGCMATIPIQGNGSAAYIGFNAANVQYRPGFGGSLVGGLVGPGKLQIPPTEQNGVTTGVSYGVVTPTPTINNVNVATGAASISVPNNQIWTQYGDLTFTPSTPMQDYSPYSPQYVSGTGLATISAARLAIYFSSIGAFNTVATPYTAPVPTYTTPGPLSYGYLCVTKLGFAVSIGIGSQGQTMSSGPYPSNYPTTYPVVPTTQGQSEKFFYAGDMFVGGVIMGNPAVNATQPRMMNIPF